MSDTIVKIELPLDKTEFDKFTDFLSWRKKRRKEKDEQSNEEESPQPKAKLLLKCEICGRLS